MHTVSLCSRVPFCTKSVATTPRALSTLASITVPNTFPSRLARIFVSAATSRIASRRSSIPVRSVAERGTIIVSPSHSSGWRPASANCCLENSGFASKRSILFIATMIGTCAALACAMASSVWGLTPSFAATTRTTMSAPWAPRARIAVNAACPGVSRNVISCPL